MELWLNILVSVIIGIPATIISAIIGILSYKKMTEKGDLEKKQAEEKKKKEELKSLFAQRDELADSRQKQTIMEINYAIEKNIMPLIQTIQIQQEGLQSQVNTIMNELIDNTKTTNDRLNKLEVTVAVNSAMKERQNG